MTFYPDGSTDNATLVATSAQGQSTNLSAYEREWMDSHEARSIDRMMRERGSVCG